MPTAALPFRSPVCLPRSVRLATPLLFVTLLLAHGLRAQDFSHPDTQPSPQAALIQKANDALGAGDFNAALAILTSLNSQTPGNSEILYDLGLTLEALVPAQRDGVAAAPANPALPGQDLPTAESCYRKAIDANPLFVAPHVALGLLLARTNRAAAARTELATTLALPDVDPALKARALRALARIDQESLPPNLEAASDELLAAVRLTFEQPGDILLSAQIAEAAASFAAAEQAYRRYLALSEGASDMQATAGLVHMLLAEHRPADAEALLTSALAQHPGDPGFTAQLAEAYLASDDPAQTAKAAPLLEKLRTANPTDGNIVRLLARVYLETGNPDLADPLYATLIAQSEARSADHTDPTLLDARAETLLRLHRPAEAEKLLQQALANTSGFPSPAALGDAATHLALAAEEIDDPKTTLQALAVRAKVQPPSPSSLFLEATANDELHQNTKAVELYKQFLAAASGNFPDQESQARQRLTELQHAK